MIIFSILVFMYQITHQMLGYFGTFLLKCLIIFVHYLFGHFKCMFFYCIYSHLQYVYDMIQYFSFGYYVHYFVHLNLIQRMVMRPSILIIYQYGVFYFDVSLIGLNERSKYDFFSSYLDVRHSLVIICMMLVAVLMAPITWYLWIYTGSANANFYFAMTLVFNVAQVKLIFI